ncbi:MAG: zinc-dependent peptidase [Dechloromonas agitata]|uniref:Zinc-dependent peptidase n=1 Tax=Dechloromonas agitata TaxID=73030 RepID=A0A930BSB9_9RHOO|nr:zinc-dependent peptidase [Dechloromonas agitata]
MIGLLDKLRGHKRQPIPDALWAATVSALPFLDILPPDEQRQLRTLAEDFLAEKEFSAAGGLELSDEICVAIAAQGCLPILKLGLKAYRDWVGIIVYPDEFVVRRRFEDETGIVHEYDDVLSGEAWEGGPLIVSWHDVKMAGDGYNVVIHEFAHKLDMLNGDADGMPALHSDLDASEWETIFFAAYDDFCARVDSGEETLIDPYASETPGEFFAVLSESFFEIPDVVAGEYTDLYDLLRRYYRQDPLARLTKAASASSTAAS